MTKIKDIYSGDPRLILGEDGSRLNFVDGQPTMDQGWENFVIISLFTRPDWVGNVLFRDVEQQIGSGFVTATLQPITIQALTDIRNEAEKALKNPAFGNITIIVTNPRSVEINVRIIIEPVGQDPRELLLTREGLTWQAQSLFPANKEI